MTRAKSSVLDCLENEPSSLTGIASFSVDLYGSVNGCLINDNAFQCGLFASDHQSKLASNAPSLASRAE